MSEVISHDIELRKQSLRHQRKDWRPCDSAIRQYAELLPRLFSSDYPLMRLHSLAAFIPIQQEPPITPFLERWLSLGKELMLPLYRDGKGYGLAQIKGLSETWLTKGKFGIPEPSPELEFLPPPYSADFPEIWFVPGLAFSSDGSRLGRGGGYYDRLLQGSSTLRIGCCFREQILPQGAIPVLEHDIPMDVLLTEDGFIPNSTRARSLFSSPGVK